MLELFASVVEWIMWFVDIVIGLAGKAMEMFQKIFDILQVAGDWLADIFNIGTLTSPGFFDTIIQPRPIAPHPEFIPPGIHGNIPVLPPQFNPIV